VLFAIDSCNIGPNNVAKARDQAIAMGFDLNEWFKNVEFIATQRMGYESMFTSEIFINTSSHTS